MKNKILGYFDTKNTIGDKTEKFEGYEIIGNVAYQQNVIRYNKDGVLVLFSGKIFNNDLLGKLLNQPGSNEAELICSLFLEKGIEGLKIVDGSFIVLIKIKEITHLFRDRNGIGGQVYYDKDCFSTTLEGLKLLSHDVFRPNHKGLSAFLQRGYIPSPETAVEGVYKLGAGCSLSFNRLKVETSNLFLYDDFAPDISKSEEEAIHEYETLHGLAIERRIAGFKNVGILLSGGYDSGGNIYKLRDIFDGKINAFSIGFNDNPWTEVPLAKILADRFGANFNSYNIDGSEIRHLPEIVKATGDPFQEGGLLVNYCAMRMAAENDVSVILGGDGNDQFFGTSAKELALSMQLQNSFSSFTSGIIGNLFSSSLLSGSDNIFRLNFHLSKIKEILRPDSFGLTKEEQKRLIQKDSLQLFDPFDQKSPRFNNFDDLYLYRNYHVDIQQVINEVIIFKASRMAENWNQNIVFPYADLSVYDFLKKLPRQLKCKGTPKEIIKSKGVAKYLHKKYLKPLLPNEITDRKKQGGFAPLPVFFKDQKRRTAVFSFISNSSFGSSTLNKQELESFFATYNRIADASGGWFWQKQVYAFKLMNLLTLAVWWDINIDNKNYTDLTNFGI